MAQSSSGRMDLAELLEAVEDAPPFAAADVLGQHLGAALGAREVSFLIADFSGRALIRLGHAGSVGATRAQGRETAERVPLEGSPHGRALATQTVEVEAGADDIPRVRAGDQSRRGHRRTRTQPPRRPGRADAWPMSRSPRTRSPTSSSPTAGSPTSSSGASARFRCRSPPRSSIACCPARYTCEAGQFTLAGWLEPAGDVGGDTFDFAAGARHAASLDDRRDGPRGRRRRCSRPCSSGRFATRGVPASPSPSRPRRANASSPTTLATAGS